MNVPIVAGVFSCAHLLLDFRQKQNTLKSRMRVENRLIFGYVLDSFSSKITKF